MFESKSLSFRKVFNTDSYFCPDGYSSTYFREEGAVPLPQVDGTTRASPPRPATKYDEFANEEDRVRFRYQAE